MKGVIRSACSLLLFAVAGTAFLGVVYRLTFEPIEEQHRKKQQGILTDVMPQADEFRELEVTKSGTIVRIFEASNGENLVGYVVELAPSGYSGKINMMVGILKTENRLTGMRILRHTETPGLGANAVRESFYRRYDGRNLVPLRVVKSSPGANDVEALTASTITTKAITNAVNEAIEWFLSGQTENNEGGSI